MPTLLLLASSLHAALEGEASLTAGWLEYGDLWSGDPLLGGFDLASPSDPWDRWLLVPQASLTWRPGVSHRFRLRANGRSLARVPTLAEDLSITHVLVSDGVPVSEAWKERLFLDEDSWRWRPGGDPVSDLRVASCPTASRADASRPRAGRGCATGSTSGAGAGRRSR